MTKIAYSCAGEGFGHAARMVALHEDLGSHFDVQLYVPPSVDAFVRGKLGRASIRPIPCFLLSKKGNRIKYGQTAFAALRTLRELPLSIFKLSRQLRRDRVEAVLSDFEPVLPLAARLAGIPIIQMNHPGIVCRYVSLDPRSWVAAIAARLLQGPWDRRILVSFFGGDVGPVLRSSLQRRRLRNDGFLAVNLKDDARRKVLPSLDCTQGLAYRLHPAPGLNFDESLATCAGVVTSAGHQTLSEALCLGKPVLALPQRGQYEQILNARMLELSGRGTWCYAEEVAEVLPRFLSRLDEYAAPRLAPSGFILKDSRDHLVRTLHRALHKAALEYASRAKGLRRATVGAPTLAEILGEAGRKAGERIA